MANENINPSIAAEIAGLGQELVDYVRAVDLSTQKLAKCTKDVKDYKDSTKKENGATIKALKTMQNTVRWVNIW
jgi:hypothetical protein